MAAAYPQDRRLGFNRVQALHVSRILGRVVLNIESNLSIIIVNKIPDSSDMIFDLLRKG